jgi:hypothetical protein
MRNGVFGVKDDPGFFPQFGDEEGEGLGEENLRVSMHQKAHKNVVRAADSEFLAAHDQFRLTAPTANFDDIIRRFPLFCIQLDYRDAELLQVQRMIRPACLRQFMEGAVCWFMPNGRAFRESEKEDVMKEFEEWLKFSTQQVDGADTVSYGAFQAWLLDLKCRNHCCSSQESFHEGHLQRLSSSEEIRLTDIFRPSSETFEGRMNTVQRLKATADGAGTDTGGTDTDGAGDRMPDDSFGLTLTEPVTDMFTALREFAKSLGTPRPHDAANLEEADADSNGDVSRDETISIDSIFTDDQVSELFSDAEDTDIGNRKMSFDVTLKKAPLPEPEPTSNWNLNIDLSPRFDGVASFLGSPMQLMSDLICDFEQTTTPADVDAGDGKADFADGNEHDASDPERGVEENVDADLAPMSVDESVRPPSNDVFSEVSSNNDGESPA